MKAIPVRSIHRPDTSEFSGSFKIRSLDLVLSGKDLSQDLHRHDFYFILAVSKGRGAHTIDFVKHPVKNNSIFVMRPGQVHQLQLKAGSEGYLLEFNKNFQLSDPVAGNELLRKVANRNLCVVDKKRMDQLCSVLQSTLDEYKSKQEGFERVIKANLEVFFVQLLRCRQTNPVDSRPGNGYQQEKLEEFLALLESNITTVKQSSAYAEMLHLSPFQLNSITRKLLGKSAAELIEDQILLEAKRYLLATTNQVNQVAFHLGYEDVSYFIRFFKKLTGHTPEAFRKKYR